MLGIYRDQIRMNSRTKVYGDARMSTLEIEGIAHTFYESTRALISQGDAVSVCELEA